MSKTPHRQQPQNKKKTIQISRSKLPLTFSDLHHPRPRPASDRTHCPAPATAHTRAAVPRAPHPRQKTCHKQRIN